jgi:hypothetical protein
VRSPLVLWTFPSGRDESLTLFSSDSQAARHRHAEEARQGQAEEGCVQTPFVPFTSSRSASFDIVLTSETPSVPTCRTRSSC